MRGQAQKAWKVMRMKVPGNAGHLFFYTMHINPVLFLLALEEAHF